MIGFFARIITVASKRSIRNNHNVINNFDYWGMWGGGGDFVRLLKQSAKKMYISSLQYKRTEWLCTMHPHALSARAWHHFTRGACRQSGRLCIVCTNTLLPTHQYSIMSAPKTHQQQPVQRKSQPSQTQIIKYNENNGKSET